MRLKYLTFTIVFIFSLIFNINLQAKKAKSAKSVPYRMVKKLFLDLKYHRFSSAMSYSIKSMAKWLNNVNKFLLEAPRKKIIAFKASFSRLSELRIYDVYIKGKYAFVQSLWVYKSPPNTTYKYKIRDQIHLLEKKKSKWYFRDYKFQGEHIIHDIKKVRRIQKKAREMDRRRRMRYRRRRGGRGRYRRRRYYRRR